MKTKTHSGFTLIEIMIVVAIIGILAAIAIPGFRGAIETSQKRACALNPVEKPCTCSVPPHTN